MELEAHFLRTRYSVLTFLSNSVGNDAKDAIAVAAALAFLLFHHQVASTGAVWLPGRQVVLAQISHSFHLMFFCLVNYLDARLSLPMNS